ncbi:uncharacterized protein [Nothobranchius furzeri]|uniref:LOC107392198-like protein n=3 Tax=Nothobranchius furzeri TaxID=105023 RepID=A0A9D2XG44_NOTFU|nr:putative LOC107392198-like protein [Nothobranchius furzeri]
MACRKGQQCSLQDLSDRRAPNSVDQLSFSYTEMCKMDSSTESDSEISPKWSDTSTLECVSRTSQRASTYKSAGRHASYSLFLDPYDGSSEDSDESNISSRLRQQGKVCGCRLSGRRRRPVLHHSAKLVKNGMTGSLIAQQTTVPDPGDVQRKCRSDSELWDCGLDTLSSYSDRDGCGNMTEERAPSSLMDIQTIDVELQLNDFPISGLPISSKGSSCQMLNCCSERSCVSCNGSLSKRKVDRSGADAAELGLRKRQCVLNMENK